MKPKKLSFDLDGVFCDFVTAALEHLKVAYPGRFPTDYVHDLYDFGKFITAVEWVRAYNDMVMSSNFWETLPAYEENVQALRWHIKWHPEDEIYFMTARLTPQATAKRQTETWLKKHGLPADRVIISESADKARHIANIGIAYSIDDLPSTVIACNALADHDAYLLDRPWNVFSAVPPDHRVKSVDQFLAYRRTM